MCYGVTLRYFLIEIISLLSGGQHVIEPIELDPVDVGLGLVFVCICMFS